MQKDVTTKKQNKNKKKVKVFSNKKKSFDENDYIEKLKSQYEEIKVEDINDFNDLPLSQKTLKGLKSSNFVKPTDIQKAALPPALLGKDILGAAQTGSGKTLAFVIPILEHLFCKQWTHLDGLGALVITPTRELAYQIFETLRLVGQFHDFSAGLIIGGKDLKFESKRLDQCNIIIGTPGRILQHMDENPLMDCNNLQILVLDEADRCLDMGFEQTMNAIIANLPVQRQTLLFSATQTKSVKDLVRLSLKDPLYIHVHQHMKHSTPDGLKQNYVVCELKDKVSILWSFIKNHLKSKSIIFFSSCKQAKYMFEIFSKLRPGITLMALYGTIHQLKRMQIYENFKNKHSAILFATDLAARGLDFPEVHWVIQADCPDDANTYIHRVGRTARFYKGGESLLLLLSSELAMLEELEEKKIPINKIEINPNKLSYPQKKMEAFLASKTELKESAKRAFTAYVKSVYLMKNKKVFDAYSLDTNNFANSLGLAIAPRIRFLQRQKNQTQKLLDQNMPNNSDEDEEDDNFENSSVEKNNTNDFEVDSDEEMLTIKRRDHDIELPTEMEQLSNAKTKKKKVITKAELAKKILKKNIVANKKIIFGEEGEAVIQHGPKEKISELAQQYEQDETGGLDIEKAKLVLREEDKYDKQLFRERVKAKHKEQKRKLKEAKKKQLEEDEFSDSDSEVDLSWVPDPDKVYNGKGNEEESVYNSSTEEQEISKKLNNKRKQKSKKIENHEAPAKKKRKLKDLSSNLGVKETEELALMLLNQ